MRTWPLHILPHHYEALREDRDDLLRRILMVATYKLKYRINGGIINQRIRARKVDIPLEPKDYDLCNSVYGKWTGESARLAQIVSYFEVVTGKEVKI